MILLPIAWQIRKRKQTAKPIGINVGLVILLIACSIILYPYLTVTVARPGSIASRVTRDEDKVILHSLLKNVYRAFDFREEIDGLLQDIFRIKNVLDAVISVVSKTLRSLLSKPLFNFGEIQSKRESPSLPITAAMPAAPLL